MDDGLTLEVTRLCTDGTPNACSFLLSRAARAAAALGYERIQTYTLAEESVNSCGGSLRAGSSGSASGYYKLPPDRSTEWSYAGMLSRGGATIATVAAEIGYGSEAAFSRAFKKLVGVPPSAWRRPAA